MASCRREHKSVSCSGIRGFWLHPHVLWLSVQFHWTICDTVFFFFKVPRRPLGRGDRQGPWECHTIILVPARWAELTAEPARSDGDASSGHGPGDEGRAAVAWRVCSSWNKTLFYHLQSPLLASPPARHLGACRLSGRLSRCSSSPTRDEHMSPSLAGSERARVLVPTALIAGRIGSITH